MSTCRGDELEELLSTARARAVEASETAAQLVIDSRKFRSDTEIVRRRAWQSRLASRRKSRLFWLEGVVDGEPVAAVVRSDGVMADEVLLQRVEIMATLGETFTREDGSLMLAGLEASPVAAMLTLIRACDRALRVEMQVV